MRSIILVCCAMACAVAGCEVISVQRDLPVSNEIQKEVSTPTPCQIKTYFEDADQDGYGSSKNFVTACQKPSGVFVENSLDCNDLNKNIHPGAVEICNGKDDNCDGLVDNTTKSWWLDHDHDGFGDPKFEEIGGCKGAQPWLVDNALDCDDDDASVHPGAVETCNGKDDNCNGQIDEGVLKTFYVDADMDGHGNLAKPVYICAMPFGATSTSDDCDDKDEKIHPGALEVCDNIDNDCDGQTDEGVLKTYFVDKDEDGYGDPKAPTELGCVPKVGYSADNTDCNDLDEKTHPNAKEVCDGRDNDCNGQTDEGVKLPFYDDIDHDGHGDKSKMKMACTAPADTTSTSDDCNDADPERFPGAFEICDGKDNDCNGKIDETVDICNDGNDLTTESCVGVCVYVDVPVKFSCELPKEFPWESGYTCGVAVFFEDAGMYTTIDVKDQQMLVSAKVLCDLLKKGQVLHVNTYVLDPFDSALIWVGGYYTEVFDTLNMQKIFGTPGLVTYLTPGLDFVLTKDDLAGLCQ